MPTRINEKPGFKPFKPFNRYALFKPFPNLISTITRRGGF